MQTLQLRQTVVQAQAAMRWRRTRRCCATPSCEYVDELERPARDLAQIFDKAHEIRGFAETAGLATTGRIADNLCRYMDEMERVEKPMDPAIVALHVAAIARAARAEEDDAQMGEVVAAELAALVKRTPGGRRRPLSPRRSAALTMPLTI